MSLADLNRWIARNWRARCRGTSLIRSSAPLGPYRRNMPRALRWSGSSLSLADFKRWIALNTQILDVSRSWVSFRCLWNTLCTHRTGACVIDVQCRRGGRGTWSQCGLLGGGLAHQSTPYRGTSLITCGDFENACLFLKKRRNCCLFLEKLRNFSKNGCLLLITFGRSRCVMRFPTKNKKITKKKEQTEKRLLISLKNKKLC